MKLNISLVSGILALAVSAMGAPAMAQNDYPANTIRLVVGFATGGSSDLIARMLAQRLTAQMNTTVIVENRDGANGNIAAENVARSKPDGYTLLYVSRNLILSAAFGEKLGYDVFKDLAPIAPVTTNPHFLLTHPSVPANTPAEFIAYVRANPNKLAYGSTGVGSGLHLSTMLFLQPNGLTALHVPYKGAAPAIIDLLAGRIQFVFDSVTAQLQSVKEKRLKALAVASLKRSPQLPEVPTLSETVMPGFTEGGWFGVMAPAKTSSAIVKKLNLEIQRALQDQTMKSLEEKGNELLSSTPEEYGAFLRSEFDRLTKVIKASGIKSE